jgi:hypothetical protein
LWISIFEFRISNFVIQKCFKYGLPVG